MGERLPNSGRCLSDGRRPSDIARRSKAHWGYTEEQLAFWGKQLTLDAEELAGRPAFAAEVDGSVVGFYTLKPGDPDWELDNLWVVPEHIGHGFGRMLFEHALCTAARGGAREVAIGPADAAAQPVKRLSSASRTCQAEDLVQANGGGFVERFEKTAHHGGKAALRYRIDLGAIAPKALGA